MVLWTTSWLFSCCSCCSLSIFNIDLGNIKRIAKILKLLAPGRKIMSGVWGAGGLQDFLDLLYFRFRLGASGFYLAYLI